jgi:oxygen-dependent protoporphyrinogen oxidase
MRIAIVGGGISGVTAAWQLAKLGATDVVLYEASPRLGGTVETVRKDGFVVETGPDGWVSEKPWARELALELGLGDELIGSKDEGRVTHIVQSGRLVAMPDGMRMMVPTDLSALNGSPLFSDEARVAYAQEPERAAELKGSAPADDESIASFVLRHFGKEVLTKVAAPLLGGVFGGDVERLSMRAVMPQFVAMERESGSLVLALAGKAGSAGGTVFTSLRGGTGRLVERMVEEIPNHWVRLSTVVSGVKREGERWRVASLGDGRADTKEWFDALLLAVPAHIARQFLRVILPRTADLLQMEASSAVLSALVFTEHFALPPGFGFLVPRGEGSALMAATFVDQKFPDRVPAGCRIVRGFFGGAMAGELSSKVDSEIAARTLQELQLLLGPLPKPAFAVTRRWPNSLPQYGIGHLERMAELASVVAEQPRLWLLGNAYRGVGLPDLVRDARAAARQVVSD